MGGREGGREGKGKREPKCNAGEGACDKRKGRKQTRKRDTRARSRNTVGREGGMEGMTYLHSR